MAGEMGFCEKTSVFIAKYAELLYNESSNSGRRVRREKRGYNMKLDYKRTVLIGFAFMSILSFWQFYDQVIPYVLENIFGLGTLQANGIMSVDNILALFMLPMFGALSDTTKTRWGKRTPYILFGTVASVSLLVLMGFMVEFRKFVPFLVCLFGILVVMSIYRSPAVAYMPDVTPKPLRSKGNAVINLVGYIGGIFATLMMSLLLTSEKNADGSSGYQADQSFLPIFLVIAAFMMISVLVMFFTINENKLLEDTAEEMERDREQEIEEARAEAGNKKIKLPPDVMRSLVLILVSVFLWFMAYNAVTTAFSRYCVNVWGTDLGTSAGYLTVATVAAIVAFVPLGFLSGKLGRKKTVLLGIVMMTVCYLCACFMGKPSVIMYVLFGVVGIGWAAINVNSFPMVVEMSSSGDVGRYTGLYYTFSMAAQIVTPLFSALLIDTLGMGYRVLFPYAVVFSVLAFCTMSQVKHGDTKPVAPKSALEMFDTAD
jgi:Na+/melibiose symporter-like transporter